MIFQVDAEKCVQQMEEEIHYHGVDLDYITTFTDPFQQWWKLQGWHETVEMHLTAYEGQIAFAWCGNGSAQFVTTLEW